jgi:NAD(P)-dependent dehydrogenase (short-subunit alcohol dehydrogenase family)
MTGDLDGKTALISGGGRGIGRGIALKLASAGALVAINYASDAEAAERTVSDIEAAGGRGFALRARLGAVSEIERLAAALGEELKRRTGSDGLDILVNNIGGAGPGNTADTSEELYDWTFSNNVRSPFFLTQALLPTIRDEGRIINISSSTTRAPSTSFIAYSMSKKALEQFTLILAKELGPRRITVNSVAPGYVETPAVADTLNDPAMVKAIEEMTLFRRIGQPEDIADMIHALAGPAGRWMTGQNIEVSGGFRMM